MTKDRRYNFWCPDARAVYDESQDGHLAQLRHNEMIVNYQKNGHPARDRISDYELFLSNKQHSGENHGFAPLWIPDFLFDFQKALVEWSLLKGRSAGFQDCGLGKTPQALVWAENVVRKTNQNVLILTPLAVGPQFVSEGEKFGIECEHSRDGKFTKKIVVTNYERLHYFNSNDFVGGVCDESSVLKNFDGKTKAAITEFIRKMPYRWLCTATPAPNDFIELGTSSEALGEMGYMDMLSRFFKNDQNSSHPNRLFGNDKWRFRGHAEQDFWRWVCSWARAIRKPSDLGFDDGAFILPPLNYHQHVIDYEVIDDSHLIPFSVEAKTLAQQRKERRNTLVHRCEKAAMLCIAHQGASIAWCHLNDEGDLLEELIPGAVQVAGKDSIEHKEEALEAFRRGQIPNLVSKGEICGHGLNFQHCCHQTTFASHSFEQLYQSVRRSWRFGQKNPVNIDIVTSRGELRVLDNMKRKSDAAEQMFSRLVFYMHEALSVNHRKNFSEKLKLPSFL